ncbi:RES family NAD+ phosphorylase [Tunicatimonas pelagia]|uniref:RES family NAD+ phosphorylase n=1 Tax=Tunicatimonas pelagia TaxID=931531 RepID=UPI002665CDDE|nr:RES family NAD+ phosphorylase [Tunicatimonas pelagia]WKN41864.1 RES family NAD+ phosphorylase [Tunicatimonas pelagia]
MEAYRITHTQYADQLYASGRSARWNTKGQEVIYTAGSRSLACLENVVHRNARGLNAQFRVMVIYVPDALYCESIDESVLPNDWYEHAEVSQCREIGDTWLTENRSAILQVPSAIIPTECNYLLNPGHPEFSQIKLIATGPFRFDCRIK